MYRKEEEFDYTRFLWLKKRPLKLIKFVLLISLFLILGYAIYFFANLPDVSYLKSENPKITALMQLRIDQAKAENKKFKLRQKWVRYQAIPDLLKKSIRISEDASFYKHDGIDFEELKESLKRNLEEGELARGGSTITQQLAKNLYLSTEKSFLRKIKEYFIAKRLEKELSKYRIFHLYLNVIEFGRGVFGVEAASRFYFGKSVGNLTLEEMVRLTAIIPRPLITNPKGNSRWLKWKCKWILRKLALYNYIDQAACDAALLSFE
ncbi:MAG: monofunctional biosynthetic peptidoglycan transglycosylase [Calditrichaceae bacterium]|nr:monofunctional biosynthetic peptidoglycan transglycosylase [Calditrichaceae bacterium]